ncbi:DUF6465 family protein [Oribacterium sp. P6A1]|uniref:DUF6465 family protein n=1 Tax=Oribacterium sp. P6A1 TaxID=1410612 RepID=UPI00056B3420|nr:DUF6465 family protein [Oribacterium sp. P6A1]
MADEVNIQEVKTDVESVSAEAEKTATEAKPKRGRKKGSATKSTAVKSRETKTAEKKTGRKSSARTAKKSEKKTADKSVKTAGTKKVSKAPELNYKSITIEFNDKKYSEKDLFDRVRSYISKHPYIVAHDIELFIKPNESCAYFTIDGFSNPDFKIGL